MTFFKKNGSGKAKKWLGYKFGRNLALDWVILIMFFVFFTAGIVAYNVNSHSGAGKNLSIEGSNLSGSTTLDSRLVSKVVDFYRGRAAELAKKTAAPSNAVDPSVL